MLFQESLTVLCICKCGGDGCKKYLRDTSLNIQYRLIDYIPDSCNSVFLSHDAGMTPPTGDGGVDPDASAYTDQASTISRSSNSHYCNRGGRPTPAGCNDGLTPPTENGPVNPVADQVSTSSSEINNPYYNLGLTPDGEKDVRLPITGNGGVYLGTK